MHCVKDGLNYRNIFFVLWLIIANGTGQSLNSRRQKSQPNPWDLYLQKLLSDSTETCLILMNILLARGETRKTYKNGIFYKITTLEVWNHFFPIFFVLPTPLKIINFQFLYFFCPPPPLARSIFIKIKKFQSNRIITFGDTGPTVLRTLFPNKRV